jgi:arabinose-5-phosphate isomerase
MTPARAHNPAHVEGLRVLREEAGVLARVADALDTAAFDAAVALLLAARAHVIVSGIGKSGHIGAKIAATLASTGTPAFFLHPAEAVHGDLGMLTRDNVLLAISHSGTTEEVLNLLPYAVHHGIPVVAITGNPLSPLAEKASVVLHLGIEKEACPLNLAPMSSTVAQLAVGDALAAALMRARGFQAEDFALRHPLGTLGKRLLIRVRDLMTSGADNPVIHQDQPLRAAISAMTGKRLGAVSMVDDDGVLAGIFCDGDLRRLFEREGLNPDRPMADVMIRNPRRIGPDVPGVKAVDLMETAKITVLPVVDEDDRPVGMIHLHQLIQSGIAR